MSRLNYGHSSDSCLSVNKYVRPCSAEDGYLSLENGIDPDQLASDETRIGFS